MTNKPLTVCVTGATGYVAGHLIERLLASGHRVQGTVRSLSKSPKLQALYQLSERYPDRLELFQADLLVQGSFRPAMRGCSVVFHTASPFTLRVAHPQRDLLDPALKGTLNVLDAVEQTPSVKRVVLTSSVVAMLGDNQECAAGAIDESSWNDSSSLDHLPYAYSKVSAERAAWQRANQQSRWQLITINPTLVVGPSLGSNPTSESFELVRQMGAGDLKTGAPRWGMGLVDVRDVAEAHVQAAVCPAANGRYLCNAQDSELFEIANALRTLAPRSLLPKYRLPTWLVWLVGPMIDPVMTRRVIRRNIGHPFRSNTQKIRNDLNLSFRDVTPGIREMYQQLEQEGAFSP